MFKRFLLLLLFLPPIFLWAQPDVTPRDTTLRVLCIGNSFSLDGSTLLPQLLVDAGVSTRKFQIYAAVYAGASLEYWDNMRASDAPLPYIYNMGGSLFKLEDKQWTLRTLLQNQPWDVVVIQQASSQSNKPNSYQPYISRLNEYIHQECLNKQVHVAWQLTWSYPQTATSGPIDEAGWREIAMIANQKCHDVGISTIIPSGTAIQNARTTTLRQDSKALTRDGLHLSLGVGRYIAAMSWYESICRPIFGKSIIGTPVSKAIKDCDRGKEGFQEVTDENYLLCQQCVQEAVADPLHLMNEPVNYRPVSYEVSFEVDGQITTLYLPQDSLIPEPAIPAAPTGYHFDGWNPAYDATSTVPQWGIHYQVVWTPNDYSFSFESNGGTPIDSLTQTYGNAFAPPADPSRTGYTFLGWEPALPDSVPAADMTFTAQWQVNTYTLAFDANGGSPIDTIVQDYDTALAPPADPVRTGYTFLGWQPAVPDSVPPADMTFTAQWQVNTYTFSFDANGGSPVDTLLQDYDTAFAPPADPVRTGYTFLGWQPALPDSVPAEDRTFTAQWQVNTYTLAFDANGGSPVDTIAQNYDTTLAPPADPVRTGYTFLGWQPAVPDSVPPTDMTFTAQWQVNTYTFAFDANGGTPVDTLLQDYDTAFASPADPVRTGYTFLGWQPALPDSVPAEDRTFTAQWQVNTYTLVFDANGGSPVDTIAQNYDTALAPPADPVRRGYTFKGWQPALPDSVPPTDMTFTAQWQVNTYHLAFNSNGGTPVDSITQDYDTALVPPADPSRTGYTFLGWKPALPDSIPPTDMTYTAQWQVNTYHLSFDSNGGSPVDSITQDYDTALVPPADPSRTGYTFLGWEPALPDSVPPTDMTFTAQWQVNTYHLAFDANGGIPVDSITQDYDTALVPPADPSRTGYTFLGWEPALPDSIPPTDMTFTAQWQVNTYTFSFDSNGGTPVDTLYQNYETALVPPADPSRTGYTFLGWKPALPDSIPPSDMTYTAQWQVNTYTFSFDSNGGTPVDTLYQNYDTAFVPPADPSRTGYTFLGWEPALPDSIPPTDMTFTAQWQVNTYHLAFDANGGTPVDSITQDYDTALVPPADPSRTGYTFLGWKPALPDSVPPSDMTFTAQWQVNTYTFSFDSNGGTPVDTLYQNYETALVPPADPSRTGYTFLGWEPALPDSIPPTDMTFTAQWQVNTYHLAFDANGGTPVDSITQDYDTALVPPADPSRTGYTFLGWEPALPDSIPPSDMLYTAQWQVNTYHLAFDANGGTPVDTIVQDYDTALVPPADPVRTGHLFVGWMPTLPDSIPPHDARYFAMWKRCDYTLRFDTDGGTELSPIRIPYGGAIVPPLPPEREGFVFLGWEPQIPTYMPASDISCKARWERAEFTLMFDTNQGSSVPAISQLYDTPITPPEQPVRHGYNFCGWQPPLPERMPAAYTTHHALWEPQQFVVRYFVGDSLVHQDSVAFEEPIPPFTPTLADTYIWRGWQESMPYWMPDHPLDFHAVVVHRLLYRFGGRADVYSPQGRLILRQADTEAIRRLAPGPYIIGGMKVWLK